VEFRILGPLEIDGDEGPIDLGGAKQRALLALLLLHANEVVHSGRLVDLLWSDAPPADAGKALQIHVSRLRRALGSADVVQTRPGGYLVAADASSLDLPRAEQLAARGRSLLEAGDPQRARDTLAEALALWRGPALAEFAAEPFAQAEIGRLEELHAAIVEDRVEAELALGRHVVLIPELEKLVARYPLRERLREQHMLALYRAGRQADALEAYRDARRALVDELGIEPRRRLQELEAAILRQDEALDPVTPAAAAGVRPGRRAAGTFVGRDRELAELGHALDDALAGRGRLFLVSGESGVGKTRLVDELASQAKGSGMTILWGRSATLDGAPPYWPWTQALRRLGDAVPELDDRGDEQSRFRLFANVSAALRKASAETPLLIVLDDAQRADETSLLLLDFLAGEVAELHVALVATFVEDADTPSGLASLADHSAHHRLGLRPLSVDDVAALLELNGTSDVDAAELHAVTGGNPRLVWQRVR
jgi:DNA-binding SARP family transcriptional activator